MDEYIKRKPLLKKAKELADMYSVTGLTSVHIIKAIEDAPTADVVEVVRCKDCKTCLRFFPQKKPNEEAIEVYYCNFFKSDRRPTDYCSFGVRKEGAEE